VGGEDVGGRGSVVTVWRRIEWGGEDSRREWMRWDRKSNFEGGRTMDCSTGKKEGK
jgi:hypothetical protein